MEERRIELFAEQQSVVTKKNVRELILGVALFFCAVITMAKMRVDFLSTMVVGIMCIVLPLLAVRSRNKDFHAERTKKSIDDLVRKYGRYSKKIDASCIDFMTLVFPETQIIVIHGTIFKFSEIIDFGLNEMASYRTTISIPGTIGRGLVGGAMFGGLGALAGVNTASRKTIKESTQYDFNITIDDFNNPSFRCMYYKEDNAYTLYSILKLIIDKNSNIHNLGNKNKVDVSKDCKGLEDSSVISIDHTINEQNRENVDNGGDMKIQTYNSYPSQSRLMNDSDKLTTSSDSHKYAIILSVIAWTLVLGIAIYTKCSRPSTTNISNKSSQPSSIEYNGSHSTIHRSKDRSNDEEYWNSVARQNELEEMGYDGATNMERNARQEYMRGGGYHAPDGTPQVHFQGSREQAEQLRQMDEMGW